MLYVRKTRSLEAALPWLYLKGISTEEMASALEVLVGPDAKGLSASTIAKLKQQWAEDYRYWCETRLDKDQWVYIWADGIYSGLRAKNAKLCALVISGVNARGQKRFFGARRRHTGIDPKLAGSVVDAQGPRHEQPKNGN